MGHPCFINGSHACCWVSANSRAIDCKQGLKCSSLRNELSSLQCLDFHLTSKRDGVVYLDIQNSIRNGTFEQEMGHSHLTTSVLNSQASNLHKK